MYYIIYTSSWQMIQKMLTAGCSFAMTGLRFEFWEETLMTCRRAIRLFEVSSLCDLQAERGMKDIVGSPSDRHSSSESFEDLSPGGGQNSVQRWRAGVRPRLKVATSDTALAVPRSSSCRSHRLA